MDADGERGLSNHVDRDQKTLISLGRAAAKWKEKIDDSVKVGEGEVDHQQKEQPETDAECETRRLLRVGVLPRAMEGKVKIRTQAKPEDANWRKVSECHRKRTASA